jgi:predicted TIM-barrel fold metal-dependent hydrolase
MKNLYVDSHVHFWNPDTIDYPWLSGAPAISQPTFPADLDAARGELSHELAGIVTEADNTNWTAEQVRPYMEHILDCFGPERVVFGPDWPVVNLAADYRRWFALATETIAHYSPAEQQMILHDNAVRFYRLG